MKINLGHLSEYINDEPAGMGCQTLVGKEMFRKWALKVFVCFPSPDIESELLGQ